MHWPAARSADLIDWHIFIKAISRNKGANPGSAGKVSKFSLSFRALEQSGGGRFVEDPGDRGRAGLE